MNATTITAISIIAACRQHIINECNASCAGRLIPCLKQMVYTVVITADGQVFYGANWMTCDDVTVCPRIEQGRTDYALCSEVCVQGTEFHAERQAMWSAIYDGADLTGAEVFIAGHTYCCEHCIAAMTENGISYAGSLDSGMFYNF